MKYFSTIKGEMKVEELTKERAKFLLEGCYKKSAVNDIFNNERSFCLQTMTRTIWTQTDNGLVPIPGFFGICD